MAHVFQTFDRSGKPHSKFRFQYRDWQGRRRTATGTPDERETRALAEDLEAKHGLVRKGHLPPPDKGKRNAALSFAKVATEYQAWGESQGGHGGRPWGASHAVMRKTLLEWWGDRLKIETLGDLGGILPRVEEALRRLQSEGRSGKTCQNYAEAIKAFCAWCKSRGYLGENPLAALAGFNTDPKTRRRALTPEEIKALLGAAPEDRRLLYATALASGLRAGELRKLTVADLDVERGGLALHAEWTKNRKPGFQPLPADLVQRLAAFAGKASELYRAHRTRKGNRPKEEPSPPLLYVPVNAADPFHQDREAAGIPRNTVAGRVDFHALRTSFVNLALDAGALVKEAQALARHSTPIMTMNVYGRTRDARLAELAEAVGGAIGWPESDPANTTEAQRKAAGAESQGYITTSDAFLPGLKPGRTHQSPCTPVRPFMIL